MDLDEEIKSREEGDIGSESREKGDLLLCSSPLQLSLAKLSVVFFLFSSSQLKICINLNRFS